MSCSICAPARERGGRDVRPHVGRQQVRWSSSRDGPRTPAPERRTERKAMSKTVGARKSTSPKNLRRLFKVRGDRGTANSGGQDSTKGRLRRPDSLKSNGARVSVNAGNNLIGGPRVRKIAKRLDHSSPRNDKRISKYQVASVIYRDLRSFF